jgi:hypothetical protein
MSLSGRNNFYFKYLKEVSEELTFFVDYFFRMTNILYHCCPTKKLQAKSRLFKKPEVCAEKGCANGAAITAPPDQTRGPSCMPS